MSLNAAIATLDAKKEAIMSVIPTTMRDTMEWQMVRQSVASALRANDKLAKADPVTIYLSALYICRLGLEIGGHGGEAFLVPFKGKCTPMIGVRGKELLAYRSGAVDRVMSGVIHEHDIYDHDLASGMLVHKLDFNKSDRGRALAAWARVWLKGSPHPYLEIMAESDFQRIVESVKKRNNNKLSPAYAAWPDEMRRNRVLSRCLKRIPKSKDLTRTLTEEFAIETGAPISEAGHVDVIDITDIPDVPLTYDEPEDEKAPAKKKRPTTATPPADDGGMP